MANPLRKFAVVGPDGVEPGVYTTEFWVTVLTSLVVVGFGVAVAWGAPVTAEQKGALLAAVPVAVSLAAAVYAVARSLRKRSVPPVV